LGVGILLVGLASATGVSAQDAANGSAEAPQQQPAKVPGLPLVDIHIVGDGSETEPPPPVLDNHDLRRKYVWSTLGLEGMLGATFAASFDQWQASPPEWNTRASGYGKRWASEFAKSAIGNTTKYSVARALHHDPSFTRCGCQGIGPRVRHALTSPFMARTRDGRRVFSPATIAGFAAEDVIPASTWYPAPRGTRDGIVSVGAGIAAKMGVDVFKEFVSVRRKPPKS
jgi:hypothetical protein